MNIKASELNVSLPFGIGGITFIPNETQKRAAWSLYVELQTRIAVQPLDADTGLLREAFTSLYSIFEITRTILKDAGPEVAKGENSFGPIAIRILNDGLRPFLAKWHPRLKGHEDIKPSGVSQLENERNWSDYQTVRTELADLQGKLRIYVDALAKISGAKY